VAGLGSATPSGFAPSGFHAEGAEEDAENAENWIDYDRYEVVAKVRPGTRREALRLMPQALPEDRFHLVVQPDTRPVQGYRLSIGKGGQKLRPSAGGESTGCNGTSRSTFNAAT
jgi:uncharacterized protein (TIGR03435 family)